MTPVDRTRGPAARIVRSAVGGVAAGVGRLLGLPLGALARWRHGKPMHPRGVVCEGLLERTGSTPPWGVEWLDETARDHVLVRVSRGAGLPPPLPDLLGLAVRLTGPRGERTDLLLTTIGQGRLGRVVPVARRDPATTYGSIMSYRTDAGTLRLAAMGERTTGANGEALVFVLAAARGTGPWRPFARLTLGEPGRPADPDVRFDAVRHPPPGMVADGPIARLRAPAYAMAREARDA